MTQKFIKYLTRAYSLRDHDLVVRALLKKNCSMDEIFYTKVIYTSTSGLATSYILSDEKDINLKRIKEKSNKDKNFINNALRDGMSAMSTLNDLSRKVVTSAPKMTQPQIQNALSDIEKKIFDSSGFIEFTHSLTAQDFDLTDKQISELGKFHDFRKEVFLNLFNALDALGQALCKDKDIDNKNLNFLTLKEIVDFIQGKISAPEVNEIQIRRMKNYIYISDNGKVTVIDRDFANEYKKIKNNFMDEKQNSPDILKGQGVNKGVVQGKVFLIDQKTPYDKIPKDRVIVTQMTTPSMIVFLKHAKALVTDEGGLLCHAATCAREVGIMAVIGTKNATKVLKDGDEVGVDASEGVVKVIK